MSVLVLLYFAITSSLFLFFFFNDTATTEIYTLSLHDALPICSVASDRLLRNEVDDASNVHAFRGSHDRDNGTRFRTADTTRRSEEHTSELQSRQYLVCRLLLEKKKNKYQTKVIISKY